MTWLHYRAWMQSEDPETCRLVVFALVKTRLKRMQHRPGVLEGFLANARLDLTAFVTPTLKHR